DAPVWPRAVVDRLPPGAQVDRQVAVDGVVVEEILLDHLALVAERDHELVDAVGAEDVHDVPENRPSADLDHRLRLHRGLFGETRAETARQDHGLHWWATPRRADDRAPCASGPDGTPDPNPPRS